MNADKNKSIVSVILSEAEGSYPPELTQYKKQDPSTSLRYTQDDRTYAVICVHLRSSVDYH